MGDFNPDVYLSEKTASNVPGSFDPDQYLAEKDAQGPPTGEKGLFGQTLYGAPASEPQIDLEHSPNYPNAKMTDPSIQDAMMVQGVGGLAKAGAGLAARGVGAGLEALPLTKNIVPTIENTANDMLLKSMGPRMGQIGQVGGIEAARDAADVARNAGMGDVFSTEIGRRNALKAFTEGEGQKIGALREAAGPASPDIMDQVQKDLMAKYSAPNTLYSNEAPQIEKSLNTVRNMAGPTPTNAGIAKGATELNQYAAGEKLKQPVNAITDVANKLSASNNAEIAQSLGSDKAQQYINALHNESGAFHLKPFMEKGAAREAVARGGGKGILQSLVQKAADTGGYRATSKGLDALHGALAGPVDLSNLPPATVKSLLAYLSENPEEKQP